MRINKKAGVDAMTDRIQAGALQVDRELYDFINDEALPGTGVSPEAAVVRVRPVGEVTSPPSVMAVNL